MFAAWETFTGFLLLIAILCVMLSPVFLVWWEVASMRRRRTAFRYRLATLFGLTFYVAIVVGVAREWQLRGEEILFAALIVAGVMAVVRLLWFAVMDIAHPKRVDRRRELSAIPQEAPTISPPAAIAEIDSPDDAARNSRNVKCRRRRHWWAKGLKRLEFGRYGLWKDSGPSVPK